MMHNDDDTTNELPEDTRADGAVAPSSPARKGRGLLAAGIAGVVVVAGVGALVFETTSSSPSASAAVVSAAKNTAAKSTASLTIDGSMNLLGITLPITGSGAIDMGKKATSMSISIDGSAVPGLGRVLTLNEIVVDGTAYLQKSATSKWASFDLKNYVKVSNSLGTGLNPTSMLSVLTHQGYQVTETGTSAINGVPVNTYSVTVTSAELSKLVTKDHLPAAVAAQVSSAFGTKGLTYKIAIGSADGLIHQLSYYLSISLAGESVAEDFTMDFSNYGQPVTITAPPASDVQAATLPTGGL